MEGKRRKLDLLDINLFPNEILARILQHLPFDDRLRMSTVCRRWNQLVFAYGDRTLLHLGPWTDYSVPIGKLADRIYRNVRVYWSEDNSNWMNVVEDQAPNLFSLDIFPEQVAMSKLNRWNPSPSQAEQFMKMASNLGALRTLVVNTTPAAIGAILEAVSNLPNLNDFELDIGEDNSPCDNRLTLSIFNGLCRLPKLRAVQITTTVTFHTPDEDLASSHIVDKFMLEQSVPYFSILKFSNLFPRLTQLSIGQVVLDPDELKLVVKSWPALEVLVLGLNSKLLKQSSLEILHKLSKLRRLELKPQVKYCKSEEEGIWMEVIILYQHFNRANPCLFLPKNLEADLFLLETVFRMPSLKEVHLFHGNQDRVWWFGQVPKGAPSCRLYINGRFKPRTSPSGTMLYLRGGGLMTFCDADEEF